MRAGVKLISSRLGCGTSNARLASDDFTPTWSQHEARLPGARAGPLRRSRLRLDSAALLGPGVRGRTRCAPAARRSNNDRESVHEARCARHPGPPVLAAFNGPSRAPGSRAPCGERIGVPTTNAGSSPGSCIRAVFGSQNPQDFSRQRSFAGLASRAAFAALLSLATRPGKLAGRRRRTQISGLARAVAPRVSGRVTGRSGTHC